jgi:hypothetical protein
MAKKFKIKAKEKKGAIHVKAMFTSLMADAEEAEKKQIKPEYIKRITATVNDKLVFEADTMLKKVIRSYLLQLTTMIKLKQVRKKSNKGFL